MTRKKESVCPGHIFFIQINSICGCRATACREPAVLFYHSIERSWCMTVSEKLPHPMQHGSGFEDGTPGNKKEKNRSVWKRDSQRDLLSVRVGQPSACFGSFYSLDKPSLMFIDWFVGLLFSDLALSQPGDPHVDHDMPRGRGQQSTWPNVLGLCAAWHSGLVCHGPCQQFPPHSFCSQTPGTSSFPFFSGCWQLSLMTSKVWICYLKDSTLWSLLPFAS